MAIKLNADSWHYRLFNKNFPYTSPPKTLCPYFWILVALIITYPFFRVAEFFTDLSNRLSKMFPKKETPRETPEEWERKWNEKKAKEKRKEAIMERLGKVLVKIFLFGIAPVGIGIALYQLYLIGHSHGWLHLIIATGICLGVVLALVGVVFFGEWFLNKYFDAMGKGITKFAIFIFTPLKWIGWMIKAGYEKACPLVKWEGDVVKEKEEDYYDVY